MEITVVVTSYNTEKTIIETLDSVLNQTYPYIHLIVSDDCSSDASVLVAQQWLDRHRDRFLSARLNVNESNYGIAKHMNTIAGMVQTDWFFDVAGDDIMLNDSVEASVDYVEKRKIGGMLFSKLLLFSGDKGDRKYWIDREEEIYQKNFGKLSAEKQNKALRKREILCSPTMFFEKKSFLACGGCDESIKNIEDWPIKMRMTGKGFKLHYMERYTRLYRQGNSISRSDDCYFKVGFLEELRRVQKKYCDADKQDMVYRWNDAMTWFRYKVIVRVFRNRRNKITKMINYLLATLSTDKQKKMWINLLNMRKSKRIVREVCRHYGLQ